MSEENVNQPESILTNTFDFGPEWLQPEHTKELENVISVLVNMNKIDLAWRLLVEFITD